MSEATDPTRFVCVVCGKDTAGRMPREGGAGGDTSERRPRYHKLADGRVCDGNYYLAEWVSTSELKSRERRAA